MKKRKRLLLTTALALALVLSCLLSGCAWFSKDEDRGELKELGETTTVDCQFNFIFLFDRGPYELAITPVELVHTTVDGEEYDLVKVEYEVLSISSDETAAEFSTCTVAMNFLDEDNEDIGWQVWWYDTQGNEVNIQSDLLEIGKTYTYYVPLNKPLEESGLKYIVVADRSGWWQREGDNYWYEVRY